jgi:phosphohistidine phosphatase SixA
MELSVMKQIIISISLLFCLPCLAEDSEDIFTVYLVRHAEKQTNVDNPPLTECGTQRAKGLAQFLSSVHLDRVYSSDYERTLLTAAPIASSQGLEVKIYNPGNLKEIKMTLVNGRQDALVVGHSNTTAVLAGMLAEQELAETEYESYDRIYQVVISNKRGRVHLLHDTFQCNE